VGNGRNYILIDQDHAIQFEQFVGGSNLPVDLQVQSNDVWISGYPSGSELSAGSWVQINFQARNTGTGSINETVYWKFVITDPNGIVEERTAQTGWHGPGQLIYSYVHFPQAATLTDSHPLGTYTYSVTVDHDKNITKPDKVYKVGDCE